VAADRRASAHGHPSTRRAPASDRRRSSVAVVATDNRYVGVEQLANFGRHGLEDFGGRGVTGDECRHASQRCLFLCEPCESLARPGIGDRGCDELGEALQALIGIGR
jgi:hypothetical protein